MVEIVFGEDLCNSYNIIFGSSNGLLAKLGRILSII